MDRSSTNRRRQAQRPSSQLHPPASTSTTSTTAAVAAASSLPVDTGNGEKVAIPRLQRPGQQHVATGPDRQRVSHACEPCRKRKSKCDALRPKCTRCRHQGLQCLYEDGKREKLKRNAQTMAAKITAYEKVLKDLMDSSHESETRQAVSKVLSECRASDDDAMPLDENSVSGDEENEDEHSVSIAVTAGVEGLTHQDIDGYAELTGYIGRSSIVRWLAGAVIKPKEPNLVPKPPMFPVAGFDTLASTDAANLNNISPSLQDCVYFSSGPSQTDLSAIASFQLPPKHIGDMLVDYYFSTMHSFFPIFRETVFRRQYETCWKITPVSNDDYVWVAILNTMFAIGALYARYMQSSYEGLENHTVYWIRSQYFSREATNSPTVEHIQFRAISGMYLIASYQIHKAWGFIDTGVRYAYMKALHLDNTTSSGGAEKALETNIWGSLCSAACLLSFLSGLPSPIQDRFASSRVPQTCNFQRVFNREIDRPGTENYEIDLNLGGITPSRSPSSSTPSNTFVASLRLDEIVNEALVGLYGSSGLNRTWPGVQQTIVDLDGKLSHWWEDVSPKILSTNTRAEQMYLVTRLLGARMLINKPGLSGPLESTLAFPLQSEKSRQTDIGAAVRCISAARQLIQTLPTDIIVSGFYESAPWWCALHYLIQAGVILIMEISVDCQHTPAEAGALIDDSAVVLQWLEVLSHSSDAASRGCLTLAYLRQRALARMGRDVESRALYQANMSIPQLATQTTLEFHAKQQCFLSETNWLPANAP